MVLSYPSTQGITWKVYSLNEKIWCTLRALRLRASFDAPFGREAGEAPSMPVCLCAPFMANGWITEWLMTCVTRFIMKYKLCPLCSMIAAWRVIWWAVQGVIYWWYLLMKTHPPLKNTDQEDQRIYRAPNPLILLIRVLNFHGTFSGWRLEEVAIMLLLLSLLIYPSLLIWLSVRFFCPKMIIFLSSEDSKRKRSRCLVRIICRAPELRNQGYALFNHSAIIDQQLGTRKQ